MSTLSSIKARIAVLKEKSIESLLTRKEHTELGKLYIAEEIILKHLPKRKIERIAFSDMDECNVFFNNSEKEIISISWDYKKSIHVVYYREK